MLTLDFIRGFMCMGLLVFLYQLKEFIGIFRELVLMLREYLDDE